MTLHVSPRLARAYFLGTRHVHAKYASQHGIAELPNLSHLPHFTNLLRSKLCQSIAFSGSHLPEHRANMRLATARCAVFLLVVRIVLWRAGVKMVGIYARAITAFVQNPRSIFKGSSVKQKRDSVGAEHSASGIFKKAVTAPAPTFVAKNGSGPQPTVFRFPNLPPKSRLVLFGQLRYFANSFHSSSFRLIVRVRELFQQFSALVFYTIQPNGLQRFFLA